MDTYIGTKTVTATPMSRGDYIAYRGWELPADEDATDAGYFIEYEPDGKLNHEDHAGYITWTPAGPFEKSYRIANNWHQRLLIEAEQLAERLAKLNAFIEKNDGTGELAWLDRDLLNRQMQHMTGYADVLRQRLERAAPPAEAMDLEPYTGEDTASGASGSDTISGSEGDNALDIGSQS
jgi:hypothetical protein